MIMVSKISPSQATSHKFSKTNNVYYKLPPKTYHDLLMFEVTHCF